MELEKQIRALRLAEASPRRSWRKSWGVSAQAVSKWERDATVPDVQLLELSAYFGVAINALFALTDETRMERIQNMVWDEPRREIARLREKTTQNA